MLIIRGVFAYDSDRDGQRNLEQGKVHQRLDQQSVPLHSFSSLLYNIDIPLTFRRPFTPPYPLDHGVSQGNPDITSCPQTPEGLSQQMYSDTFERWLDTYRINTASYFFTSFAFLPLLAKAKTEGGAVEPGNILNISVRYVAHRNRKELRERCGG